MNRFLSRIRRAAGATKRRLAPSPEVAAWRRACRLAERTPRYTRGEIELGPYMLQYSDLLTLCPQWNDIFVRRSLEQTAFDGLAALDAAARYRPDLVLSDLGLPGMDGYELARRLRAQNGLDDVVLVALSGYGRDEDKRRALDAGFDHHLVKPPNLDALAELLRQVAGAAGEPARAGQSSS